MLELFFLYHGESLKESSLLLIARHCLALYSMTFILLLSQASWLLWLLRWNTLIPSPADDTRRADSPFFPLFPLWAPVSAEHAKHTVHENTLGERRGPKITKRAIPRRRSARARACVSEIECADRARPPRDPRNDVSPTVTARTPVNALTRARVFATTPRGWGRREKKWERDGKKETTEDLQTGGGGGSTGGGGGGGVVVSVIVVVETVVIRRRGWRTKLARATLWTLLAYRRRRVRACVNACRQGNGSRVTAWRTRSPPRQACRVFSFARSCSSLSLSFSPTLLYALSLSSPLTRSLSARAPGSRPGRDQFERSRRPSSARPRHSTESTSHSLPSDLSRIPFFPLSLPLDRASSIYVCRYIYFPPSP